MKDVDASLNKVTEYYHDMLVRYDAVRCGNDVQVIKSGHDATTINHESKGDRLPSRLRL